MTTPVLPMLAKAFLVGGAVMIDFRDQTTWESPCGTMTLTRTCSAGVKNGTTDTLCVNAPITALWLDQGDGLQNGATITGPLPPGTYTFQAVATINGQSVTVTTPAIIVAKTITLIPDDMNDVLIKALEGAYQVITMPPGMHAPIVFNAMPVGDFPALPLVSVNEELIQQVYVPIGQNAPEIHRDGSVVIAEFAKRAWRISIISNSAAERDFLRQYTLAVLRVLGVDLFTPLGRNITHRVQAASYSTAKDGDAPGFFGSDIMYDMEGTFNVALQTSVSLISQITTAASQITDGIAVDIVDTAVPLAN